MNVSKRLFVIVVILASMATFAGFAAIAGEEQKKPEGIPQIVHLDATATLAPPPPDLILPPKFRIRVRGTIFVPENTRVATKILIPMRNSWYTTETFGPYPKGQTVNYVRSWDVDARSWNGKAFSARLMASSSAGAVTREATVVPHR